MLWQIGSRRQGIALDASGESPDPKRVVIRDSKSYCAILLDDNNRKSLARLHFNSPTTRYVGTFAGKAETRHPVSALTEIYKLEGAIVARIAELERGGGQAE